MARFVLPLFGMLLVVHASAAQQAAMDYFEPVVSQQHFTELVRHLDLSYEQRQIVEIVYMDYLDGIEALAQEADEQADQVGRQRVIEALSGQSIVDPTRLRQLRLAVLEVYESYLPTLDEEFDKLTLGVRSVLTESQREQVSAQIRRLRRAVLLHPRHRERDFHEYAGDGVDVLLLAEQAMSSGELENIRTSAIRPILTEYEQELDRLLRETAREYRLNQMQLRKARISRNHEELRRAEHTAITLWEHLYTLNEHAVRRISEVAAAQLGSDAARQWRYRFDRACFAWMFAGQTPDRQYAWLTQQELSGEQREQVQSVYEDYLAKRFVLVSEAIGLMVRARAEHQSIVHARMNPAELSGGPRRVFDDLLRNSGEMAGLEAATSTAFEKILDRNQLLSFRNATRRR